MQPVPQPDSLEQLVAVVAQLQSEVQRLRADNEQLRAENAELRAENVELRRRLAMNSSNSSKPPSSDGLTRPRPQPGVKGSGRRRGKQPAAPGSTLRLAADPDRADFATLRSYLSTAAKHGMDALDVLEQLFTTGPWTPEPAISS